MFNLLDKVLHIEKSHGPHRDPKKLTTNPNYSKYGPLGGCKEMQEQYADQCVVRPGLSLLHLFPREMLV